MRGEAFRFRADRGQVLPVYVVVVGGLLFLMLAYLAVGQSTASRGGAQTAADAAALAATQDQGGQLRAALLAALRSGDGGAIGEVLAGHFPGLVGSCDKADEFAADNGAHVQGCDQVPFGYHVQVRNNRPVGRSIVSATEHTRAVAEATAVLTPLCQWQPNPDSPTPTPSPGASGGPSAPGPSASPSSPGTLVCRGGSWVVDPTDPSAFPSVADLFSVHLTD